MLMRHALHVEFYDWLPTIELNYHMSLGLNRVNEVVESQLSISNIWDQTFHPSSSSSHGISTSSIF